MAELIHGLTHITEWPSNFYHNILATIDTMNARSIFNIAIILGVYMLIRPFIVRFFAWTHLKSDRGKEVLNAGLTKGPDDWNEALVSANQLRGKKGGFSTGEGGKVRKREVTKKDVEVLRGKIERGEVKEEEMFELLVDYDEGVDGW